jgi:hypothetical protein
MLLMTSNQLPLFETLMPGGTSGTVGLTNTPGKPTVSEFRTELAFARAFCFQAVDAYWNTIQSNYRYPWPLPELFAPLQAPRLEKNDFAKAQGLGVAAATKKPVEAGYLIGSSYARLLPRDYRSEFGVYYTPPSLSTRLISLVRKTSDENRVAWRSESVHRSKTAIEGRWYAANTREPIRDETLRGCMVSTGAVVIREGITTTSSRPRYALAEDFAQLFDPELYGSALLDTIESWRKRHLTSGALARIQIRRRASTPTTEELLVAFPNGETRHLASGPSSLISKAVIEVFAVRFLGDPAVILLSESSNKIIARDSELARAIGLQIAVEKNLPDIILVDLAPQEPLVVFVEVVATGGEINQDRKEALTDIAVSAGFAVEQVAFGTAYLDRAEPVFMRTAPELAWRSFVWFVSEPDNILYLHKHTTLEQKRLYEFLL